MILNIGYEVLYSLYSLGWRVRFLSGNLVTLGTTNVIRIKQKLTKSNMSQNYVPYRDHTVDAPVLFQISKRGI